MMQMVNTKADFAVKSFFSSPVQNVDYIFHTKFHDKTIYLTYEYTCECQMIGFKLGLYLSSPW